MSSGFRPYRSARTPPTGIRTIAGTASAVTMNPISAEVTSNTPVSVSRIGDTRAVSRAAIRSPEEDLEGSVADDVAVAAEESFEYHRLLPWSPPPNGIQYSGSGRATRLGRSRTNV